MGLTPTELEERTLLRRAVEVVIDSHEHGGFEVLFRFLRSRETAVREDMAVPDIEKI